MLEKIQIRGFEEPDRAAVEQQVVSAVSADPERFIKQYIETIQSFDGRYVAADLFKATFAAFNASRYDRNRYNAPVHNAAAVLSAEQFRRALADASHAGRDMAVFLTGIPGAGKTSTILGSGALPRQFRVVFEGQLSRPESALPKIAQALAAGLAPLIIVVHARPEDALDNTFKRFAEYGRGASIGLMANLQGNLPSGLQAIYDRFGEKIGLQIRDVRDRTNPQRLAGWSEIDVLGSEGGPDAIKQRLTTHLERQRAAGALSVDGYLQARGTVTRERAGGLDATRAGGGEADGE